MFFSAEASFVAAGVLGAIGVATLRHVREPRSLLFASMPLLFAAHQFSEGLVWLALDGHLGAVARDHAVFMFTFYALGVLPLLMPTAVILMEPPGGRRVAILGLTLIGALVMAWDVAGVILFPTQAFVEGHSIAYRNQMTSNLPVSFLYILATCGALILSSHVVVRTYGVLNIVGLTVVHIVRGYAFASVWCFYAALLSVILYRQFYTASINIDAPNAHRMERPPFMLLWLRKPWKATRTR